MLLDPSGIRARLRGRADLAVLINRTTIRSHSGLNNSRVGPFSCLRVGIRKTEGANISVVGPEYIDVSEICAESIVTREISVVVTAAIRLFHENHAIGNSADIRQFDINISAGAGDVLGDGVAIIGPAMPDEVLKSDVTRTMIDADGRGVGEEQAVGPEIALHVI